MNSTSVLLDYSISVESPDFMVPPLVHLEGSLSSQKFSIEVTVPITTSIFLNEKPQSRLQCIEEFVKNGKEEINATLPKSKNTEISGILEITKNL